MIPRILEYEEGQVKITPEAYTISEIYNIIMKYGDPECEPYLRYVYMLSYPDTPYKNLPVDEREENALFDVKETVGDFDENEPLLQPAITRLKNLWTSRQTKAADELEEELERWTNYLRNTPTGGEEMKNRFNVTDKFEKLAQSAANLRKIADDEIAAKMKGSNELGEY